VSETGVIALVALLHPPGLALFAALLVHLYRHDPGDARDGGAGLDGPPDGRGGWRWRRRTRPDRVRARRASRPGTPGRV
jgi:hypothetical protein